MSIHRTVFAPCREEALPTEAVKELTTTDKRAVSIWKDLKKPVVLDKNRFLQLGQSKEIKSIKIFGPNQVVLVKHNDEEIPIASDLIELPRYNEQEMLQKYLDQSFVQLTQLSDGTYKIRAHLKLLGGGGCMSQPPPQTPQEWADKLVRIIMKTTNSKQVTAQLRPRDPEDVRKITDIVQSCPESANTPNSQGVFPLLEACELNIPDPIVNILIEAGANVNIQNQHGVTPLLMACYSLTRSFDGPITTGNVQCIELLIRAGADVNAESTKGDTALRVAVRWTTPKELARETARDRQMAIVRMLLQAGADPTKITPTDYAKTYNLDVKQLIDQARPGSNLMQYAQLSVAPPEVVTQQSHSSVAADVRAGAAAINAVTNLARLVT